MTSTDGLARHGGDGTLGPQSLAAAGGTAVAPHEGGVVAASVLRLGLAEAPLVGGDDAFVLPVGRAGAALALPLVADAQLAGAVKQGLARRLRQLAPGKIGRATVGGGDLLGGARAPAAAAPQSSPGLDRTLADAQAVVDEQLRIELGLVPEAAAVRAHAERAIEGEHGRRQPREADAAVGTGVVLTQQYLAVPFPIEDDHTV